MRGKDSEPGLASPKLLVFGQWLSRRQPGRSKGTTRAGRWLRSGRGPRPAWPSIPRFSSTRRAASGARSAGRRPPSGWTSSPPASWRSRSARATGSRSSRKPGSSGRSPTTPCSPSAPSSSRSTRRAPAKSAAYILADAVARAVVCEDAEQLAKVAGLELPALQLTIAFEDAGEGVRCRSTQVAALGRARIAERGTERARRRARRSRVLPTLSR